MAQNGSTGSTTLPAAGRGQLRRLILDLGEGGAAAAVGVSRSALLRAVADLPIRRGTALLLSTASADLQRADVPKLSA